MGSEKTTSRAPRGTAAAKNSARARSRVWRTAPRSPRASYRADRVDTATVRPMAVRDMRVEYTGMMSWYSPMVSAPTSRDRTMR